LKKIVLCYLWLPGCLFDLVVAVTGMALSSITAIRKDLINCAPPSIIHYFFINLILIIT